MTTTDEQYVPSDEDVREGYALAPFEDELPDYGDEFLGQTADDRRAAWSRWLAAHDARVRRDAAREALDGLAKHFDRMGDGADQADQWAWEWHAEDETRDYRDTHYPEETP